MGRHQHVERVIKCFIDQDYKGEHTLLLYNNSPVPQELSEIILPSHKKIILINNHRDLVTQDDYQSVGDIYRDALSFVPEDTTLVNSFDSDDVFLPNHVSEAVKAFQTKILYSNLGILAYKPQKSWFLYGDKIERVENTLEPSIFVDYQYLKTVGFAPVSIRYHQQWLDPLISNRQILVDPEGLSTLLYNWEKNHGTYKISGLNDDTYENFKAHRKYSTDNGDRVLTPCSNKEIQHYYNLVSDTNPK